jgi:hypothetical protein
MFRGRWMFDIVERCLHDAKLPNKNPEARRFGVFKSSSKDDRPLRAAFETLANHENGVGRDHSHGMVSAGCGLSNQVET